MARYQVGFTTLASATNVALFDIRTGAADRVRVLEIGLWNVAATSVTLSLERQTTLGTTSTTVVPQAGDPAESAATSLIGTAWSVAPASTAVPMRRVVLPANVGAGVIFPFGFGDLVIPVSSSLLIMNRGAASSGIMNGYVLLDE